MKIETVDALVALSDQIEKLRRLRHEIPWLLTDPKTHVEWVTPSSPESERGYAFLGRAIDRLQDEQRAILLSEID